MEYLKTQGIKIWLELRTGSYPFYPKKYHHHNNIPSHKHKSQCAKYLQNICLLATVTFIWPFLDSNRNNGEQLRT